MYILCIVRTSWFRGIDEIEMIGCVCHSLTAPFAVLHSCNTFLHRTSRLCAVARRPPRSPRRVSRRPLALHSGSMWDIFDIFIPVWIHKSARLIHRLQLDPWSKSWGSSVTWFAWHCAERFLSAVDFECLKPRSSSPVRTSPSLPFALLVLIEPGGKHRRRMTQMTQGARVDGPSEAQDSLTIFKNSN